MVYDTATSMCSCGSAHQSRLAGDARQSGRGAIAGRGAGWWAASTGAWGRSRRLYENWVNGRNLHVAPANAGRRAIRFKIT